MSFGPQYDPVFWVVRNPRDPNLALVEWQTLDARTQTVVFSNASLATVQADAQARNEAL